MSTTSHDYLLRCDLIGIKLPTELRATQTTAWTWVTASPLWKRANWVQEAGRPSVAYAPRLRSRVQWSSLLPPNYREQRASAPVALPECHHVSAFLSYLEQPGREANWSLLVNAISGAHVIAKGRKNGGPETLQDEWLERASRLRSAITQMKGLADALVEVEPGAATLPKKRRLQKTAHASDPVTTQRTITYTTQPYGGRMFSRSVGCGAQGLPRRVLSALLPDTVDLDIVNAAFTIVHQVLCKLDLLESDIFSEELAVLRSIASDRDAFAQERLAMPPGLSKDLLIRVLHGAVPGIEGLDDLRKASRLLRWIACETEPTVLAAMQERGKRRPDRSCFAVWWQIIEDFILSRVGVLGDGA